MISKLRCDYIPYVFGSIWPTEESKVCWTICWFDVLLFFRMLLLNIHTHIMCQLVPINTLPYLNNGDQLSLFSIHECMERIRARLFSIHSCMENKLTLILFWVLIVCLLDSIICLLDLFVLNRFSSKQKILVSIKI